MGESDNSHLIVAEWAQRHCGVFTRASAQKLGMTEHQFRVGRARRQWVRYRGVWQLIGMPDCHGARAWAALMRAGAAAVVTGPTALLLHGLDVGADGHRLSAWNANTVYLSAPTNSHMRIPGVVTLRETGIRVINEPVLVADIPVAARERAVIDTIRLLGWRAAKTFAFRSTQVGWVQADEIASAIPDFQHSRGAGDLRQAAAALGSGAHSEAERKAHRVLQGAGIDDFVTNMAAFDDIGLIGYIDIAFTQERVAIEIDGFAWHSSPDRFQSDRDRQNRLVNAGWTVLRFTWEHIHNDPSAMVERIRSALQRPCSG